MPPRIESKEFWKNHIQQLKSSGLSRATYCRKNHINYDRLGYWFKKELPKSSVFIPVQLEKEKIQTSSELCTLEFRGYSLKIYNLTSLKFILEITK